MIIGQTRAAAAGKLIPAYNRHSGTSGRLPQVPATAARDKDALAPAAREPRLFNTTAPIATSPLG